MRCGDHIGQGEKPKSLASELGFLPDKGERMKLPRFYPCGGGGIPYRWALGWLTGKDGDLVSILPSVNESCWFEFELLKSPTCSNRGLAVLAFLASRFLLMVNENLQNRLIALREHFANP